MVIKNKNEENRIQFGGIACGTVVVASDEVVMKTEPTYSNVKGDFHNAVNLENGALLFIGPGVWVRRVKCALEIE